MWVIKNLTSPNVFAYNDHFYQAFWKYVKCDVTKCYTCDKTMSKNIMISKNHTSYARINVFRYSEYWNLGLQIMTHMTFVFYSGHPIIIFKLYQISKHSFPNSNYYHYVTMEQQNWHHSKGVFRTLCRVLRNLRLNNIRVRINYR